MWPNAVFSSVETCVHCLSFHVHFQYHSSEQIVLAKDLTYVIKCFDLR